MKVYTSIQLNSRLKFFFLSISCKNKIENGLELCQNMSCLNKQQNEKSVEKQLNLKMDVSDITGGLQNLRLKGNIAEKIIGLTVGHICLITMFNLNTKV